MRLQERSDPRRSRWRPWTLLGLVVVVVVAASGAVFAVVRRDDSHRSVTATGRDAAAAGSSPDGGTRAALTVASWSPSAGARDVASNATVTVDFSVPVKLSGDRTVLPTFSPAITGSWSQSGPASLTFAPSEPFVPYTTETVTVPSGPQGIRGQHGQQLERSASLSFTVADGSTLRLQQLLAQLGYLPLAWGSSSAAPAPDQVALPQQGTFTWRWPDLPSQLTSLWSEGEPNAITRAAVMTFENQNNLAVDGLAGPMVWTALLSDVAAGKGDSAPYTYVLVSKVLPETLTLWDDGVSKYAGILVNTGAPGADTTDGTYAVFEHVVSSDMKGTNPDGTKYNDPDVPWASYFNGGDALHGFVRASYGWPQSNGCVEMPVATAGLIWPLTPIGTLVTITGPPVT